MPTITTHFISLHPIDLAQDKPTLVDTSKKGTDVSNYTEQLIEDLLQTDTKRSFKFTRSTTEVYQCIDEVVRNNEHTDAPQAIADRLLDREKKSQQQVGHMGTKLLRGCLLQVHFSREGQSFFLLAKVDYNEILDDQDLKKRIGLPFKRRIIKACLVPLGQDNAFEGASIYDSHAPAEYWWKDFLELTEEKTDEANTETAFRAIEAVLASSVKSKSKSDYIQLRNHTICYFRTQLDFNYETMVKSVFGNYKPNVADLDMSKVKAKLAKLPQEKRFDTQFNIKSDVIKARTRTTVPLAENIDLQFTDGVPDLDKIITPFSDQHGKGIMIRSEKGFEFFARPQKNK